MQGRKNSSLIHPEILNCPDFVTSIPRYTSLGSIVSIGWKERKTISYHDTGSIINRYMVLTTASALRNSVPDLVQPITSIQVHRVEAVLLHPNYNATDQTNDIALVRLLDPFDWSSSIFPACLFTNQSHTPIVLYMTGVQGLFDVITTQLHPMYNSDCQREHPYRLQSSQLCARNSQSLTTSISSTEQLYWTDSNQVAFLVGLTSNTTEFHRREKFIIFTRISAHLEWISENGEFE